ncbi:hypothetical protein [Spirillospora sp. NBC_01491]|uniref:hypothetical protein n=1 Tax=Spirillospora sp. NBC_01491 TaxID=2976007 RepID=UPI002E34AE5D|nr:hypothetical protein [Spirillospora sp. NBC_01491]
MVAGERPVKRAYAVLVAVLVPALFVGVVVVNVAYTRHLQEQSDRRWCSLLKSLDSPEAPATTARGVVLQQQVRQLRTDLGCEDR